jgi:aquaporin Z
MKKYLAELIGTMALVLFGCGAAVIAGGNVEGGPAGLGLLGISLAFGFAVVAMAYTIGGISGCHINPAITIAMLVAGKISTKDAAGYIVAQFIGATIGAAILGVLANGHPNSYGANGWGEGYLGNYSTTAAFVAEAVFTFLFLYVILNVTSKHGNSTMAGLAIGITLVLIHMVAIPITGTSVNPARSFGPAIFAGGKALSQLWLFIVAPIVGGVAAALVWKITGEDNQ